MLTREQIVIARNTPLSDNFSLLEMINSSSYPELVEWPSEEEIKYMKDFAVTILQPIRDKWGRIMINSGKRNEKLNSAVGGVKNSVHQIHYKELYLGVASDIVPAEAKIEAVFDWAYENIPEIKTAILYRKPSVTRTPFIHLDNRTGRIGRAKLEKVGPGNYISVE